MKSLGSVEDPCTEANSNWDDRRYGFCRCAACGLVARCTPSSDYLLMKIGPYKNKLCCESCSNLAFAGRCKRCDDTGTVIVGPAGNEVDVPCRACNSTDVATSARGGAETN